MKGFAASLLTAVALSSAATAAPNTPVAEDYARDAITAATPGLHALAPTATCIVWENAEGLGVGPAQLGGMHGLSLLINVKPLPGEAGATGFDQGLGELKASYPKAPAWMFAALQRNRSAIEAACAGDHPDPLVIHKLTARDKAG